MVSQNAILREDILKLNCEVRVEPDANDAWAA